MSIVVIAIIDIEGLAILMPVSRLDVKHQRLLFSVVSKEHTGRGRGKDVQRFAT
jgi:hypothetical protein